MPWLSRSTGRSGRGSGRDGSTGLVFLPVTAINLVAFREGVPVPLRAVWYLTSSFAFIAYVVWMHGRYGQTLGKMATHVRVLDVSESRLSGKQAFMREIVPIVLTAIVVVHDLPSVLSGADPNRPAVPRLPVFYWIAFAASFGWFAAELLTMLTNSKRRAVHDFIAASVVVRSPKAGFERVRCGRLVRRDGLRP